MLYSQSPPLTADDTVLSGLERDLDVRSDQRMARRRTRSSIDSPYSYRFGEGQPAIKRPSIGRRMIRALIRFSITVLIGVGATLGWQSYGYEIREILISQAPTLGMWLPIPSTKGPAMASASADSMQLGPLASSIDAVRRSVDQLAVKQDLMARNIASLRAAEEDRQKTSAAPPALTPPPAPVQQTTAVSPPKPPQAKIDSRVPTPAGSQFSR
jgi:hypothetical protein